MTDFNPNEHLRQLHGKDYLDVKWRLVWFQQVTGPRAGYVTYELEHDRQTGYARYACIAWDGSDETWREVTLQGNSLQVCGRVATGMKSETRTDFPDFAEKAETGSIGRALAGLGFGTQFAPELDEKQRVVDSPTERHQPPARPPATPTPHLPAKAVPQPAQDPIMTRADALRERGAKLGWIGTAYNNLVLDATKKTAQTLKQQGAPTPGDLDKVENRLAELEEENAKRVRLNDHAAEHDMEEDAQQVPDEALELQAAQKAG